MPSVQPHRAPLTPLAVSSTIRLPDVCDNSALLQEKETPLSNSYAQAYLWRKGEALGSSPCRIWRDGSIHDVRVAREVMEERTGLLGRRLTQKKRQLYERDLGEMRGSLESFAVCIPVLSRSQLLESACTHYNERRKRRLQGIVSRTIGSDEEATLSCAWSFLARISVNYLRHVLSPYERELGKFGGSWVCREAYLHISLKVLAAIALDYPYLESECQRQFEKRLYSPRAFSTR